MVKTLSKKSILTGFVVFGAFVFAAVNIVRVMAREYLSQELVRYQECRVSARKDCQDSMVWRIYDVALILEGGSALTNTSYKQQTAGLIGGGRAKMPLRSSEEAALIESAELVGLSPSDDGFYRVKGGSEVTVNAKITGKQELVELYLVPKGIETAGIPVKVGTMKSVDGKYTAKVTITNGYVGELEIRASGPDKEQSQLYFDIVAE